ncbi:MAG: hypothetical protein JWO42_1738 [Chloroflexi bacterium]|jgi:hypothetical protein|nr:hypothetical protein [Chloroflexota bacterium]
MSQSRDIREDALKPETVLGDGISCNGVDASAARRAHMRELTMARQAAEKRHARRGGNPGMDRPAQLAAAQERTVELHAELARIDAEHRTWMHEQGHDVPEPRPRYLK